MLLRSDSESVSNFRPERLTFIFKQFLNIRTADKGAEAAKNTG